MYVWGFWIFYFYFYFFIIRYFRKVRNWFVSYLIPLTKSFTPLFWYNYTTCWVFKSHIVRVSCQKYLSIFSCRCLKATNFSPTLTTCYRMLFHSTTFQSVTSWCQSWISAITRSCHLNTHTHAKLLLFECEVYRAWLPKITFIKFFFFGECEECVHVSHWS